jgi:hypothetical protein
MMDDGDMRSGLFNARIDEGRSVRIMEKPAICRGGLLRNMKYLGTGNVHNDL